jgi:surface antigen
LKVAAGLLCFGVLVAANVWAEPQQVSADDGGYPYADKPCVWAPQAAEGGVNWCKDYDFGDTPNDAGAANTLSTYGYAYRNCTDYTAWKVASLGVDSAHYKGLGNAKDWAVLAHSHGLDVDDVPAVGSVAVRTSGKYGHTAYVSAVNSSGVITVAQYNYAGDGSYSEQSGTKNQLGFSVFVHFETYETTQTVGAAVLKASVPAPEPAPPAAVVSAVETPAAVPDSAPVVAADDEAATEAPTETSGSPEADEAADSGDAPEEQPAEPQPAADTPEATPAAAPADIPAPVLPPVWQISLSSPPSVQIVHAPSDDPPAITATSTSAHQQAEGFTSWPLLGLTGVVLAAEALPLRAARRR